MAISQNILVTIALAPLVGAIVAGLFGRQIGRAGAHWVTILGVAVVVIGVILIPLPGPGWLIVFLGMTILGSEYHWARRLTGWLRMQLARFWERWRAWRAARAERKNPPAEADGPSR